MIDDVLGHHALFILLLAHPRPARHTQFGVVLRSWKSLLSTTRICCPSINPVVPHAGCQYNTAAMAARRRKENLSTISLTFSCIWLSITDDVLGHHALFILLLAHPRPARHTQFRVVLRCRYNIAAMSDGNHHEFRTIIL